MIITDKKIRITKICGSGKRGLLVNLPKKHLERLGFEKGDTIEMFELGNSLLLKFSKNLKGK